LSKSSKDWEIELRRMIEHRWKRVHSESILRISGVLGNLLAVDNVTDFSIDINSIYR